MSDLMLPYGLQTDGSLITPDPPTPRGAACDCVCPSCKRTLLCAQGPVVRPYFRHAADSEGQSCTYAPETIAHLWAKQIIIGAGYIVVPPLVARYRGAIREVAPARRVVFTVAADEVWLGDIERRPDVLAETADGLLAIEIWVAHQCEPAKLDDFRTRNLAAIEIDLSAYRAKPPDTVVLSAAARVWLHHPTQAEADRVFAEGMQREEQARLEKLEVSARLAAERAAEIAEVKRLRDEAEAVAKAKVAAELAAKQAEERRLWMEAEAARLTAERETARQRAAALAEAARQREAELAATGLAAADAAGTSQRCVVCGKPWSPFGFGLPPKETRWACRAHRVEVDAQAVRDGLVTG